MGGRCDQKTTSEAWHVHVVDQLNRSSSLNVAEHREIYIRSKDILFISIVLELDGFVVELAGAEADIRTRRSCCASGLRQDSPKAPRPRDDIPRAHNTLVSLGLFHAPAQPLTAPRGSRRPETKDVGCSCCRCSVAAHRLGVAPYGSHGGSGALDGSTACRHPALQGRDEVQPGQSRPPSASHPFFPNLSNEVANRFFLNNIKNGTTF